MPRRNSNNSSSKKADKASSHGNPVPLDMQAAPRAAQALRLRRLGFTYAQIAEQCGYKDESGARKVIKNATKRIVNEEARELVSWQLDALDEALQVVRSRIRKNDEHSLWAVDRLAPLLKRQAELMGLDVKNDNAGAGLALVSVPIAADVLEAI